ncbi:MAG TPA: MFS transporter [Acidimicrobiales bacterium]|nr:MFS transporter [Acidimicrobiales bacterium]
MFGLTARGRLVVAFGAFGVWWGGWGALLPEVQRSADVDDTRLGIALLLIGVGALGSMRVTGYLVDRFGGVVLPLSVAALALAGIGPAFVEGVAALAVSMAVLGVASGAYDVAVNAEASRLETLTAQPLLSLAHAGFSFGVIFGSLGAGAMRSLAVSLAGALVALGVVLGVIAGYLSSGVMDGPVTPAIEAARGWPWWRPPRPLAVLGVLMALAFLVESAWQTWSAVHLERDLGASPGLASVGPAVFGASAGIGRVLVHRRAVPGREAGLVALGAIVAAVASVVAALVPVTALVVVAIAFAGLGTAAGAPLLLSLAGRSVPLRQAGAAVGTVTTVGYLGFVVAPAAVGGLAGATTLPVALAAVAVAAVALAGGTAALVQEPAPGRRS